MTTLLLVCRLVLAVVFAVAAVGKLLDLAGSRRAAEAFGVPARFAGTVGVGLPVVELAVGVALVPRASAGWAAVLAVVLLVAFAAAMVRVLARGEQPDCHCFGVVHSAPVRRGTLARNGVLTALAAFVAVAGWRSGGGADATGWIAGLSAGTAGALIAGVVAAAAIAGLTAFSFALLRQQGRILQRLDALERGGGQPGGAAAGPALGDPAPDFTLDGPDDAHVPLSSLWAAGRPVALLFADPGCGPCVALLPEVAAWQDEHAGRLTVAVVSSGAPEVGRPEHGRAATLRQRDGEVSRAYGVRATPSAVLVTGGGRIAAGPVGGAAAIRDLVAAAVRSPTVPPPRVGDPAPRVALPLDTEVGVV